MPLRFTVYPLASATPNPLGITFGTEVELEVDPIPEKLINKDIPNISLVTVDTVGVYLTKGPFNAVLPWSIIISFNY